MPTDADIARYKANLQDERESATLYRALASAEKDAHLAEIYQRLAGVEERHATQQDNRNQRPLREVLPSSQPAGETEQQQAEDANG